MQQPQGTLKLPFYAVFFSLASIIDTIKKQKRITTIDGPGGIFIKYETKTPNNAPKKPITHDNPII